MVVFLYHMFAAKSKKQNKHEQHTLHAVRCLQVLGAAVALVQAQALVVGGGRRVTAKDLFSAQEMSLQCVRLVDISTNKTALIVKSVQPGDERALAVGFRF
jgi:hypothetical protein